MQRVLLLSLFPSMPAFTTLDTRMKPTLPLHTVTKPSAGSTLQRRHLPTGCEDARASEVRGKGGERKEGSCPAPLPWRCEEMVVGTFQQPTAGGNRW